MNSNRKGTVFLHIVCLCSPNFGKLQNPNMIWYVKNPSSFWYYQWYNFWRAKKRTNFKYQTIKAVVESLKRRSLIGCVCFFLILNFQDCITTSRISFLKTFFLFNVVFSKRLGKGIYGSTDPPTTLERELPSVRGAGWHGGRSKWSPGAFSQPEVTGFPQKKIRDLKSLFYWGILMIPSLQLTAISPPKKMGWQVGRLSIVFVSFWGVGRHGLFSPANCLLVSGRNSWENQPHGWDRPPSHPKKIVPFRCEKILWSCCFWGFLNHLWTSNFVMISPPKKWEDFVEAFPQIAENIAALKMCFGTKNIWSMYKS